ncbi:putative ankyrin repeat domain-containing protein 19 isoform X2 [Oryctolagus cuniculus]|uniref:putative ankyrin repeat domain-containing protein 19 isoform X2 n=1 Tax=Oryctolagus cuniculus TaxID=9986 RepID=UPI003879C778
MTPLMKATQYNHEECAAILLHHGADPNHMDENGNIALHYAAYNENLKIGKQLLLHNADIERINKDGFTLLLIAVHENREKTVEFLIVNKADIYAVDNMNRTTLMLAQQHRSTKIVNLLLEQKNDVSHQDSPGCPAEKEHHQLILDYKEKQSYEMLEKRDPDMVSPIESDYEDVSWDSQKSFSPSPNEEVIAVVISCAAREETNKNSLTDISGVHKENTSGEEHEAIKSALESEVLPFVHVDISEEELGKKAENEIDQAAKESQGRCETPWKPS